MKRILVGTDGSACAEKALEMAATLAEKFQAELIVLYSIPPASFVADSYPVAAAILEEEAGKTGREVLASALEKLRARGIQSRTELLHSHPADALADTAIKDDVDLVVVGSRGLGGVKRLLMGSTSDRLVRTCERSVLVVR